MKKKLISCIRFFVIVFREVGLNVSVGSRNEHLSVVGKDILVGELRLQQDLCVLTNHHSARFTVGLHLVGHQHIHSEDIVPHNVSAHHASQVFTLTIRNYTLPYAYLSSCSTT